MLKMKTTRYRQGNKYNAKKTKGFTSGKLYDSKAERDRAEYLKKSETEGEISAFAEHPKVQLTKYQTYKPDFVYSESDRLVFEDVMGAETDRFKINVKLWRERGPGVLRISKRMGRYGKWTFKDIHPDTHAPEMWDGYSASEAKPAASAEQSHPVSSTLPPLPQENHQ
jgi:hypothetical protein